MDPYIGKFLDNRYELLEMIGSGGMAQVYRARCHRLNRLVAVKILRADLAHDADFRRRFHDESQAVAMLSHPNIMSVYDVSRSGDIEYIVMELIDGITLKQYMEKKGVLNWRESLHFITQIMKGLSHAHSRGIIHRDIKPHNIMVLRDGSVKVADFGIARLASSAQSTLTQEALGSVHYISPEQAKGSRVDARTDIYSAGVVLYEMTTGRLPFEGDSAVSIAIQHINSMPLAPRELNPEIPEALEKIIMRAMAPSPDDRYASADDMLRDLEEFRKNPNVNFAYHQFSLADELIDEPTRVIPVARTSSTGGTGGGHRPPDHGGPSRQEPKKQKSFFQRNGFLIAAIAAIFLFVVGIGYFLWVFFFSGLMAGTEDYEVPTLIGQSYEEVLENEEYAVFNIVLGDSVPSETEEAGIIVDQDVDPGRMVKEGATIVVDVSTGPEEIRMPNIINKERTVAVKELEDLGLKADLQYESSETITEDYVISASKDAGDILSPGETVTVTISTGPSVRVVTVLPLTGLSLREAQASIERMNLALEEVVEVYSEDQVGNVVYQSIRAGTEVPEGAKITLHVSKGPEPTTPEPSPSVQPSPSPSPSPSPDVTPANKTKTYPVTLPDGEGAVHVRILVDGVVGYEQSVDRTNVKTIYPTLSGSGVCDVEVYFDGELSVQSTINFDE